MNEHDAQFQAQFALWWAQLSGELRARLNKEQALVAFSAGMVAGLDVALARLDLARVKQ